MTEKRFYSLTSYSLVQAIQSFATTLFLCSIYFWTKERYHFNNLQNLLLNALQGFVYIWCSGLGGKLSDRIGYNRQLKLCVAVQASILALGWIPDSFFAPYLIIFTYTIFTASFWPALEAAVMHVPASTTMPVRIGYYNLTWAVSGAIGFFLSGGLFHWQPDSIFWTSSGFHLAVLIFLLFPVGYADKNGLVAMDIPHTGDDVPAEKKRYFLHAAWLANALGYMMFASFTALAPAIGEKFGLSSSSAIWLACTLFFSRAFSFYLFRRWEGWHYHSLCTLTSAALLPLFMAIVFFSGQLIFVFLGLALFGIVNGLSYYQSLYYSLDYGDNKGEHGGLHEAVIGMGLLSGPLSGALGAKAWGEQLGAQCACIGLAFIILLAGFFLLYLMHYRKTERVRYV
jgi:MFS family permease